MSQHRTPLRYPGGKQRLSPFILELIEANDLLGGHYVEPYAGGAGVALELLLGNHVSHIHLNDSSLPIFAFWNSVISRTAELCRRISRASVTVEEWKKRRTIVQNPSDHDELEVGFSTLYLNRCNRSGVLSGGLIGGLLQKGTWKMDARFPRNELIRRIEAIAERGKCISLRNWDAEKYIKRYITKLPSRTLVYCDPPYFDKSSRLYLDRYQKSDHARIAHVIQEYLPVRWIVSYDSAGEILGYYSKRRKFCYNLQYNACRVYRGREVFILCDSVVVPRRSSLPYIDVEIRTHATLCPNLVNVAARP